MSLPSVLLLVLSCSLDNLAVSILYGSRNIAVPFTSNLLIAAITSAGTLACMIAGRLVAGLLPGNLPHLIGSLGIALTGAWVVIQEACAPPNPDGPAGCGTPVTAISYRNLTVSSLATILEDPFIGEVVACRRLSPKEASLVGLALSLNNFANGFAAGVAGSHLLTMTIALVLTSILTLWTGLLIGRCWLADRFKEASGMIAGLMVLGIGVYELLI